MATAKRPEAVKCVAYENSSPWCILRFKTLQKSLLCICNDMLIYTMQVWKRGLIFKRLSQLEILAQWCLKPYKFILCSGTLATLGGVVVVMTTQSLKYCKKCIGMYRNVLLCTEKPLKWLWMHVHWNRSIAPSVRVLQSWNHHHFIQRPWVLWAVCCMKPR